VSLSLCYFTGSILLLGQKFEDNPGYREAWRFRQVTKVFRLSWKGSSDAPCNLYAQQLGLVCIRCDRLDLSQFLGGEQISLDNAYGSGISLNQTGDQSGETFTGILFHRDMGYMDLDLNTFSIEEVIGEDVPPACILWYLDEEAVASFLINDSRFTGLTGIFSWS
jgi:hypothetical protein